MFKLHANQPQYTIQYNGDPDSLPRMYGLHEDEGGCYVRSDEVLCSKRIDSVQEPFKYYLRLGDWITYGPSLNKTAFTTQYMFHVLSVFSDEEISDIYSMEPAELKFQMPLP